MLKYIEFLDKYKYKLIIFVTLFVAIISISIKDLKFEGNYKIWFDKNSKILNDYEKFRVTFSGDDSFAIAFEDKDGIFNKKPVNTVLKLTHKFENMQGVRRVNSLTNYQYISAEDDDVMIEDFLINTENLKRKEQLALKDNLIVNQLISKDGLTTMISVKLANKISIDEEVNIHVMDKIKEILDKESAITGYRFYLTGVPAVTASLVTIAIYDAMILVPVAVIIVIILLFFLFRNIIGILIPSVVIVYTFLIVLSIQILLGYKINNFTVNIPSFVSAIAMADALHFYLAWSYYKVLGKINKDAVTIALKTNMLPIALTSITTAIGFASLGRSPIEPISTLGIAITTGAMIAFIFSVTIVPAILLMMSENYKVKPFPFLNFSRVTGYGKFIVKNDKKIVASFSLLLIGLLYGLNFVKIDSNNIKYFTKNTTVREGSTFLEEKLTGPMIYEIVLDSKVKEGIKNPKFLSTIVNFENELKDKYHNIRFTTSLKDIVVRMQKVLNSSANQSMPKNQNLVAQYLLLYSMSLPQGMEFNDQIDTNERYLRLTVNSDIQDTSEDLEMIRWIKKWWNVQHYDADVQGQAAIFAYMQANVIDTLIYSIMITLCIVALLMLVIFKNIKMLWLFVLPNVAPIVLVGGIMGYAGISIDIGIAISAAVILGIAVDDTIHFFSKYLDASKTKSFEDSIDYVLQHSGTAMVLTTFMLSLTFSVFMLSSFVPNINFAIVTIIALNIALLLDMVLLPAILSIFFNQNYKRKGEI